MRIGSRMVDEMSFNFFAAKETFGQAIALNKYSKTNRRNV